VLHRWQQQLAIQRFFLPLLLPLVVASRLERVFLGNRAQANILLAVALLLRFTVPTINNVLVKKKQGT
jgi:hypothetical protein